MIFEYFLGFSGHDFSLSLCFPEKNLRESSIICRVQSPKEKSFPMSCYFFKNTLFLISILMLLSSGSCNGRIFTFEMHHRFSDEVKRWSDSTGRFTKFPPKGSFEYYNALVLRDQLIRGRRLSESESESALTFSDGNSTSRISSLGL